jgi:hypothetical protein
MDLGEIEFGYWDWLHLAKVAGSREHGDEPSGPIKSG